MWDYRPKHPIPAGGAEMTYRQMIDRLARRRTVSVSHLSLPHRAALAAALMDEVGDAWGMAFLTDTAEADHYPALLRQALAAEITPAELGQAILDGAIQYSARRVERDLQVVAKVEV